MFHVKVKSIKDNWEFEVSGPDMDGINRLTQKVADLLYPKPKPTDTIKPGRRLIVHSWYHAWKANYHTPPSENSPFIIEPVYCPRCYFGSGRLAGHKGKHWNYRSRNQKPTN